MFCERISQESLSCLKESVCSNFLTVTSYPLIDIRLISLIDRACFTYSEGSSDMSFVRIDDSKEQSTALHYNTYSSRTFELFVGKLWKYVFRKITDIVGAFSFSGNAVNILS